MELVFPHASVAVITIVLVPPKPITVDPGALGACCTKVTVLQSVTPTKLL